MQLQDKGNAPQFKFQLTPQLQDFGGKIRTRQGRLTGRGCRAGSREARRCLLYCSLMSQFSARKWKSIQRHALTETRQGRGRYPMPTLVLVFVRRHRHAGRQAAPAAAKTMVSDVTMTYFRRIMKYRRCVRVCRSTCMWRGKNSARRLSKPTHAPRGKRQADPTTDGTEVLLSPGSEENGREREVARSIIPVVR